MYLLSVLCMAGLTAALPVLLEPPNLPYSKVYPSQDGEIHTYTQKVDTALSPVENNNKEVEEDIVKFYPVSIPPPPELPPFDYSTLKKQHVQRARSDNSVELEFERFLKLKNMKPIDKPIVVIEKELKPIENFKSEEKVQHMGEYKFVEEPKSQEAPVYVMEPMYIEEHKSVEQSKSAEEPKSVEEPIPIEEQLYIDEPKSAEEFKSVEELIPIEEPLYLDEPKSAEEFKSVEELIPIEEPLYVDEPKSADEPKSLEEFKSVEEPIPFKEPKSAEEPTSVEKIIPLEELVYVQEPKPVEKPKSAENIDSPKVETKEEPEKPLEDIPVVIQFSIPTTTFLSSIISKLPSLSSFSWPFHIPSFFSRPRLYYPIYDINDEIYPYY